MKYGVLGTGMVGQALAGKLVTLLSVLYVYSRLLLISNVNSALAASWVMMRVACWRAVRTGCVVSCQSLVGGWLVRQSIMLAMLGVTDRKRVVRL